MRNHTAPGHAIQYGHGAVSSLLDAWAADDAGRIILTGPHQDANLGSDTNMTVVAAGYADTVEIDDGSSNLVILSGYRETASLGAFSSRNTVIMTGGRDSVSVAGDNSVAFYGHLGSITVLPTLRGDSQTPLNTVHVDAHGSGRLSVSGAGEYFTFHGDTGRYTVDGGGATFATIDGGSGGGLFIGGDFGFGTPPYSFHVGNNVVTAGLERSTVIGSQYGTSQLQAAGFAGDTLIGGEYGQTTLSGAQSTGDNLFQGYLGAFTASPDLNATTPSSVFQAGGGNDTLIAGAGASTLSGGGGADLFGFVYAPDNEVAGGNAATITDFNSGADHIRLQGFSESLKQILAGASYSGGATILHLDGGTTVTVENTHLVLSDLTR